MSAIQAEEHRRLAALRRCRILDTPTEERFDGLVRLAALVCRAPIALVGFVDEDRVWLKSKIGLERDVIPRARSFASLVIDSPGLLIIPDASKNGRQQLEEGMRFCAGAPLRTADGSAVGLLAVMDRVPRRLTNEQRLALEILARQAEGQLALEQDETRERLIDLLEATTDLVAITDGASRRMVYMNHAGRRMLGIGEDEAVSGLRLIEFRPPEEAERVRREAIPIAIESGIWSGETIFRSRGGRVVPVSQVILGRKRADGTVEHVSTIARDITDRKRLENQALQSQKMEAIGRLAGGVAHDFNNLMTAVIGYSDLILGRTPEDDPLRGEVEAIRHAGERAAELTRQLLAFSRKQVLEPQVLSLDAVVAGMRDMLQRMIGEDVELVTELHAGAAYVQADPGQVEQVLMNLAVNGRDAMPDGGKLTICTEAVELDAAAARDIGAGAGPHVLLEVRDSGCGMDLETQLHIFEPFFTTKEQGRGTGLGLAMVWGIVRQSGGAITVESAPERGSSFRIYMPRVEAPRLSFERYEAQDIADTGTETVLLVEDEDSVRTLARIVLERRGYSVVEARDGVEALRMAAGYGHIDLVLTDVVMPQMGGREMVERLLQLRPDVRVLYMSGHTNDAVVHYGVLDPSIGFLSKPFTATTLARKVREVLDSPPSRET